MLSRRLGRFRSHFGHYEGKKCCSATTRDRNLWVTGKTIHFVWSKTFRFYRCEINSQVMAFDIQDFFDVCQSIAMSVGSQDHQRGRSVFQERDTNLRCSRDL